MARAFSFLRVMVQTRSRGHSATGAVCYRFALAAQSRFPGRDGTPRTFDYSHRRGIDARGCALPEGASDAWRDPIEWARRIEQVDTRKDARQCRDDVVAIPYELRERAEEVLGKYAQALAAEHRTPVHWAVHDLDSDNPHAHVLYAGRRLDGPDAFARKRDTTQDKTTVAEWGRKSIVDLHRAIWKDTCREFGVEIDFRTQGEHAQKHIGPRAWHQERKAIERETADAIEMALDPTNPLSPDELRETVAAATSGLTVTEAATLDRDPTTDSMIETAKPVREAEPDIVLAHPPMREAAPDVVLAHPPMREAAPDVVLPHPPMREAAPDVVLPHPPMREAAPDVVLPHPPMREPKPDVVLPHPPMREPKPDVVIASPQLIDASEFAQEKQRKAKLDARDRLDAAITEETIGVVAEHLIAQNARFPAEPTFYGLGPKTNSYAVETVHVVAKHFYLKAPEQQQITATRWTFVKAAILKWRDTVKDALAVKTITKIRNAVWPVHWRETQEGQQAAAEAAERRRRAERARRGPGPRKLRDDD